MGWIWGVRREGKDDSLFFRLSSGKAGKRGTGAALGEGQGSQFELVKLSVKYWGRCGEAGTLCTVGRRVKCRSCRGKEYGGFSKS